MRLTLGIAALCLATAFLCAERASADPSGWGLVLDAPASGPADIQFFDESHGIGKTGRESLLLTEDGGRTWREVRFAGEPRLGALAIEPSGHAWLIAQDDQLLHSADRGRNWESVAPTTDLQQWTSNPQPWFGGYMLDLAVVDAATVWVVGGSSHAGYQSGTTLVRSRDGGQTWQQAPLGEDVRRTFVGRVQFLPDGEHVWVSAVERAPGSDELPVLLHSGDGGDSWERFPLATRLRLLYFSSPTEGRALSCTSAEGLSACPGGFSVMATSDGGRTWQTLATVPSLVWASEGELYRDALIDPVSPQEAWIVSLDCPASGCPSASSYRSVALHTLDGGQTWETTHLPFHVTSMDFFDGQRGVLVTSLGVLVTGDGLRTWDTGVTPVVGSLRRVGFVDSLHGWGVSTGPIDPAMGTLVRSDDGGRSWRRVQSELVYAWHDIDLVDSETAWATARCRREGGDEPCLVRLELGYPDGGSSQDITVAHLEVRELYSPEPPGSFDFVSASTGWVITGESSIAHTHDGGATWETLPVAGLTGPSTIGFLDASFGWAVVGGSLLVTEDGGRSWAESYGGEEGLIEGPVEFVDSDHGWATVGSPPDPSAPPGQFGLVRTIDGGRTWTRTKTNLNLTAWVNSLDFVDPSHGIGAIEAGMGERAIVTTEDGGETWHEELRTTDVVWDVFMLDREHGWVSAWEMSGPPEPDARLYAMGVPTVAPAPPPLALPTAIPGSVITPSPGEEGLAPVALPATGDPPDEEGWLIPVSLLIGALLLFGALAILRRVWR